MVNPSNPPPHPTHVPCRTSLFPPHFSYFLTSYSQYFQASRKHGSILVRCFQFAYFRSLQACMRTCACSVGLQCRFKGPGRCSWPALLSRSWVRSRLFQERKAFDENCGVQSTGSLVSFDNFCVKRVEWLQQTLAAVWGAD